MNIASAVEEPALQADFFDEKGLLKEYQPKSMNVLAGTSDDKPIMIEFGCGLTPLSFDRKLILQADTGADANAINKKTFDKIFPEVKLEESTYVLQNFDKRLIRPIGSFRCFLRWKGHKYRVKFEVMGIDTPNLLSRETTFLMGILKKCLQVEIAPKEPEKVSTNEQNTSLSIPGPGPGHSGHSVLSMEGVFGHSVPPAEKNLSTEGVFCHAVPPMADNSNSKQPVSNPPTEATGSRSVSNPPMEASLSTRSSINCANLNLPAPPESVSTGVSGQTKHSLSILDLPLTQEKVESTYADVFQGLGKFSGDPYKLRLKLDAVPAKHRPRKVPVHLQDAFHEEVD